MTKEELWQAVLSDIELQISKPNFLTWLKNSRLVENQEGVALVALPNNFAKESIFLVFLFWFVLWLIRPGPRSAHSLPASMRWWRVALVAFASVVEV